ncbi:MAG: ComEC/Rec2 family competence protein [Candidatus Nomurabacteria bacterium]|nr:ComEC/Rec2 family competence protein [Candidatus Nomurabacteria bacterium]
MQDKIFYASCFGFIVGVFLRSFLLVNLYVIILIGVIALASIVFFTFISKNNWGIIFGIFILAFSFGIFRFQMVDVPAPSIFESSVGQKMIFSGKIIDEPTIAENDQKLNVKILAPQGLALGSLKARPFPAIEILISANLDENYQYGDEINFEGTLKKPENFITDQGKNFDYVNYLRKDGIFYVMSYPKIEIMSHGNGNFIKSALFYVKDKFLNKMNLAIREPESLLMGGLILGEKSSFNEALRQSFVDTGTIHIVALSGYNVTIVAEWIMKIFSFSSLPKNFGIGAGIITILLFVLMTGGSSTAVRAGIMASLALFSRVIGRNYDVSRALIIAGVIMILINPFVLVFDVSFQLSFIATVAVIFFAPKIEKYFLWITPRFKLRDIISVTCAAYIFVLPFILYKMGNLSLVALPANALILPFIPLTMILGFLTGFAGLIWYIFAIPLGYISYLFLHYELGIISFFSNIPFAALTIPNFPFIVTLLIYIYFIYRLFGKSIKSFFTEPF